MPLLLSLLANGFLVGFAVAMRGHARRKGRLLAAAMTELREAQHTIAKRDAEIDAVRASHERYRLALESRGPRATTSGLAS